jgi:hypothetical protein
MTAPRRSRVHRCGLTASVSMYFANAGTSEDSRSISSAEATYL